MGDRPIEQKTCLSIKSKKNPADKCAAKAIGGDFCIRHEKSKVKVLWSKVPSQITPFTRKQKVAVEKIYRFWISHGRRRLRKCLGPCTFVPDAADNESDILTFEPVKEIPLKYRFSYADASNHIWLFDIRFFVQMMHYGGDIKNPFSQEVLPAAVVTTFQKRIEILRSQKIPIVYVEEGELSPEQLWNQKVLDVFIKMNSLGYAVNIVWFDMMTVITHERFYTGLYNLWTHHLRLSDEERERMVPGYLSGRSPLFRWAPERIVSRQLELKWWRKQNLSLMKAFLSRGQDAVTQSSNTLTILTALANCHRYVAEAFPWLVT